MSVICNQRSHPIDVPGVDSLDDAVRILGAHTPIGCWTYLITDGKTRETAQLIVRGAPLNPVLSRIVPARR